MAVLAPDARMAGMGDTYPPRAAVISWIFFAWAAEPFFTLITTFVFAPYFATHVAANPSSGQSLWGFATAAAGLTIGDEHGGAAAGFDCVHRVVCAAAVVRDRAGFGVDCADLGVP